MTILQPDQQRQSTTAINLTPEQRRELEAYHSYNNFIALHRSQLSAARLPEQLWPTLYAKVYAGDHEDDASNPSASSSASSYDITNNVELQYVEDEGRQVVATKTLNAAADVWLLDHAWTTSCNGGNANLPIAQLCEVEGLLDRMWAICDMETVLRTADDDGQPGTTDDEIEALTTEQRARLVWVTLFQRGTIQRYATHTPKSETQRVTDLTADDIDFNYYVNDEIGSAVTRAAEGTNCHIEPLIVITQGGIGYSMLWMTKTVDADDVLVSPPKPKLPAPQFETTAIPNADATTAQQSITQSASGSQQTSQTPPVAAQTAPAASEPQSASATSSTAKSLPDIDDVTAIMQAASVTREQATAALAKSGNVVDAVVELQSQPSA